MDTQPLQNGDPHIQKCSMLGQSIVLNASTTQIKEEGEKRRRIRIEEKGLRLVPIASNIKTSSEVLEVLGLRGNHPMEFIMPLLNKVMEGGMFRLDISL